MRTIMCLIAAASLSMSVSANENKNILACIAGASADIDGSRSFTTNASSIRFVLTLQTKEQNIVSVNLKHAGAMEGMPDAWFQCSVNGAGNLYTCVNGAEVIWYFPARQHGVIANVGVTKIIKENRANAAGIYNYSCVPF